LHPCQQLFAPDSNFLLASRCALGPCRC